MMKCLDLVLTQVRSVILSGPILKKLRTGRSVLGARVGFSGLKSPTNSCIRTISNSYAGHINSYKKVSELFWNAAV